MSEIRVYDRKTRRMNNEKNVASCLMYYSSNKELITEEKNDFHASIKDLEEDDPTFINRVFLKEKETKYPDGLTPLYILCLIYLKEDEKRLLEADVIHYEELEFENSNNMEIFDVIFDSEEDASEAIKYENSSMYRIIDEYIQCFFDSKNFIKSQFIYKTSSCFESYQIRSKLLKMIEGFKDYKNKNICLIDIDDLSEPLRSMYRDNLNCEHAVILTIYKTCKSDVKINVHISIEEYEEKKDIEEDYYDEEENYNEED